MYSLTKAVLPLSAVFFVTTAFLLFSSWQPPVDAHSFRQTQTALTAHWLKTERSEGRLSAYETPLFGHPWKVPFEFPLYQALVARLSEASGKSITRCGRLINSAFWLLVFIPLYIVCRDLRLGLRFFLIASVFLLCCPLYLYWGRAILIESTALFFGFVFLCSVTRAVLKRSLWWWALALLAGLQCALVKVTTFPSFAAGAMGCLLLLSFDPRLRRKHGLLWSEMAIATSIVGIALLAAAIWTHHADTLKETNPLAAMLISDRLQAWNYGSLEQRFSVETWKVILQDRLVPNVLGGWWVVGLFLACLPFCRGRDAWVIAGLIALFFLPVLLFTNLHSVHDYYQFANAFWIVLALALAISSWSRAVPAFWGWLAVAAVAGSQIMAFHSGYYPFTTKAGSPALEAGELLKSRLPKDAVVLVIGDDWSPEIAFFSERRCIYLASWIGADVANQVLQQLCRNPSDILGQHRLGAVVVNVDQATVAYKNAGAAIAAYLRTLKQGPSLQCGPYEIFPPSGS